MFFMLIFNQLRFIIVPSRWEKNEKWCIKLSVKNNYFCQTLTNDARHKNVPPHLDLTRILKSYHKRNNRKKLFKKNHVLFILGKCLLDSFRQHVSFSISQQLVSVKNRLLQCFMQTNQFIFQFPECVWRLWLLKTLFLGKTGLGVRQLV